MTSTPLLPPPSSLLFAISLIIIITSFAKPQSTFVYVCLRAWWCFGGAVYAFGGAYPETYQYGAARNAL